MNIYEAMEKLDLRWPKGGMIACPAHVDKTPSLKLYQRDFYCFSCGRNGDAYGLIALFTGVDIGQVLKQHKPKDGQSASRETLELVGPQAMRRSVQRRWLESHAAVWQRVWEVFGDFQDQVLLDEIDRMSDYFEEVKDRLESDGLYFEEEPPSVKAALEAIDRLEREQMKYLNEREVELHGS